MKIAALLSLLLLVGGCALTQPTERTVWVAPTLAECMGVAPQTCLQLSDHPGGPWRLHYSGIEGFIYEEGFVWALRVREVPVPDPPADAPSVRLVLVAVLSRTPVADTGTLAGSSWTLLRFGLPGAPTPILEGTEITLTFSEARRLGGNAGCNTYGADTALQRDRLTLSPIVTTLMACSEPVMAQERAYLDALQRVTTLKVLGDELLLSADGLLLIYQRAVPQSSNAPRLQPGPSARR